MGNGCQISLPLAPCFLRLACRSARSRCASGGAPFAHQRNDDLIKGIAPGLCRRQRPGHANALAQRFNEHRLEVVEVPGLERVWLLRRAALSHMWSDNVLVLR